MGANSFTKFVVRPLPPPFFPSLPPPPLPPPRPRWVLALRSRRATIATRKGVCRGGHDRRPSFHSSEDDTRRLAVVRELLRDFEKRWQFTPSGCGAGGFDRLRRAARSCMCGGETDEERLERIVRAKVRRDVKIAFAWDGDLSELGLEAKERYMMELARFEHLTYAEQKIYMQNGGMALEVHGS